MRMWIGRFINGVGTARAPVVLLSTQCKYPPFLGNLLLLFRRRHPMIAPLASFAATPALAGLFAAVSPSLLSCGCDGEGVFANRRFLGTAF